MNHRNIWAPWRLPYLERLGEEIESEKRDLSAGRQPPSTAASHDSACFLAEYWQHPEDDAENFVIARNDIGMLLLNRYPYSNGHLLVALGEGRPMLRDYDPEARAELWKLVEFGCELMDFALNPQGRNIGINEGRAGGAGIPQHLHVHIVPRWSGDTNFITVVGQVRVVPAALEAMYATYIKARTIHFDQELGQRD